MFADCRRLNSSSSSFWPVRVVASDATDWAIASYAWSPIAARTGRRARPTAWSTEGRRWVDHAPRTVAARTLEELAADVLQGDDAIGDDPRPHVGRAVLPSDEQPLQLERPDLDRLGRLEDHRDRER
jgi:hypothetical protein